MTKSPRHNRRKVAALGIALASVSALAITTSTAQADIGPNAPGVAGDARVLPAIVGANNLSTAGIPGADGLDQPAPVVALNSNDQPGANAQIRIHNQWRAGDRVLFQVRDSSGNNCATVPKSIGYSAAPTVVSSANAYAFAPGGDIPFKDNAALFGPDDASITTTNPGIKPEFQVNLLSSTQCAPNGIKDLVEILFTNEGIFQDVNGDGLADVDDTDGNGVDDDGIATNNAIATDAWFFTMTGISYNVGAQVTPGPLRNLPLAQNATATPGIFNNTPGFFGANEAAIGVAPLVQDLWTTTAFVVPVTLAATNPNDLTNDGSTQNLGTITFAESTPGGFRNDFPEPPVQAARTAAPYTVCYGPNIGNIVPGLVTATGPVVPGSISVAGNCITFSVRNSNAVDTVVLSNILAPVIAAGDAIVYLDDVPALFENLYLKARDNTFTTGFGQPTNVTDPSSSVNSDVNTVTSPILVAPVSEAAQVPIRIGGANRFETASKIAANLNTCSEIAIIVNGSSYPDALSSTYLAGALNTVYGADVPILLTNAGSLPQATTSTLRELGVRNVYIVGGNAAVNQSVEDQLEGTRRYFCGGNAQDNDQNIVVDRLSGNTRYDTNREVVAAVQSVFAGQYNNRLRYQTVSTQPTKRTAIVATGENFADALTAGPLAYEKFPLILTTGATLSPQALQTMKAIDIEQVVIFGGESAVSAGVATAIEAQGISVIRLAGADRYATNVAVNNWAVAGTFPGTPAVVAADLAYDFGLGFTPNSYVFMARGDNFADALASAPLVADSETLLVLTGREMLPAATESFLESLDVRFPYVEQVVALGLGGAISTSILAAANNAVN